MFRLRAKALLAPTEARHITHWAIADWDDHANNAATANVVTMEHIKDLCFSLILKILVALSRRLHWCGGTKLLRAKTIGEKDQQQADADDQRRYNRQDQRQPFKSQVHEVRHDQRRLDNGSAQ